MILRSLEAKDSSRCAQLEELLFPEDNPWPQQAFTFEFAQPHTTYLGVESDGLLLGYGGIARLGPVEDPEFEIHTIGVDPVAQRRGIARSIMQGLLAQADVHSAPVYLEVRVDNLPAITMYEGFGFEKVGVRKRYYQPSGADAYTMLRPPQPVQESSPA